MPACRSCGSEAVRPFLDLGHMPLADGFRTKAELLRPEARYPLEVAFCEDCGLVQILVEVDPEELFCREYPYFSSFSDHWLEHSRANVERLIRERQLDGDSLVVELASNDGYLLQYFVERGIGVQGIDPAEGPAKVAIGKGVPTLTTFFTKELAEELRAKGVRADVVVGNNVMAHVPDLNGFVAGIATLLKEDGTTSIEAPYVRSLIDGCQFDTIYHEHLCYFSVTAVKALFERHGLYLRNVTWLGTHGGSLRYEASPEAGSSEAGGSEAVEEFLRQEREAGVDSFGYYAAFSERVGALRDELRGVVREIKARGQSIAAYGAAAKGTILLNHAGLGRDTIDFVVDRNVHKQGLYVPGVNLEIRLPEALLEEQPDYVLILPWNLREEIMEQQAEYRNRGGQFIVPVPEPEVVS